MKVPANISADKLIMDYLARVTEAGLRYLPKGARMAFVGSTRTRIQRACGPAGDTARVAQVLAELGDPEDLVKQERARLDAAWVKRRAEDKQAGAAAAAVITAPREYRPLRSRWKPAADTRPLPIPLAGIKGTARPEGQPDGTPKRRRGRFPSVGRRGQVGEDSQSPQAGEVRQIAPASQSVQATPGPQATQGPQAAQGPQATQGPQASPNAQASRASQTGLDRIGLGGQTGLDRIGLGGQTGLDRIGLGGQTGLDRIGLGGQDGQGAQNGQSTQAGHGSPGDRSPTGSGGPVGPDGRTGLDGESGKTGAQTDRAGAGSEASGVGVADDAPQRSQGAELLRGASTWAARGIARQAKVVATLSRRHPLEITAIVLLGLGGLLFPFPLWLLGAIVALMSRFFQPRDKWFALLGPPFIALLGSVVTAVIAGGRGNPVEVYTHALRLDVGFLLRAGSVLCAAHLAVQVRRGPQVRIPPWRR
jgi:hypothetical protein